MASACEEFRKTLISMLSDLKPNEDLGETLSSFVGECKGFTINEQEMIKDVEKGLKSYEGTANEHCSLRSILKRPKRTHSYIAPLEGDQLSGFKLLPSKHKQLKEEPVVPKADADVPVKPKKRNTKPKGSVKQPKLVLSFQRTSKTEWKFKEEPQKIVPIYSERLSGNPTEKERRLNVIL